MKTSKNTITIIILLLIFFAVMLYALRKEDSLKVLKIVSGTEFYIDFNQNHVADIDELVSLDIVPSESINKVETLQLGYLSKEYAKKTLLNKYVKYTKTNGKQIITTDNGIDYEASLIQNGLVVTSKNKKQVQDRLNHAKTLDLVAYHKYTNHFHKLDCKFAQDNSLIEIIKKSDLPKKAKPCKICMVPAKPQKAKDKQNKYPRDVYEKYSPIYKDSAIEFYITDFTKYYYPSQKCLTTACQSLLKEINNAKYTIDFAIYGIDQQPEITKALINAQKRGVTLRWVYDTDTKGQTIYLESIKLSNILKNNRKDVDYNPDYITDKKPKDAIMHNKFFIFDNKKVWTGSANISHTDLSGFNANSVILINSSAIASIYKTEFEKMYSGYFHTLKSKTVLNSNKAGNSTISVYFSPQDKIIDNHIIELINKAQKYVYVPVFVVTHKNFNDALIKAQARGVDVRLIVDATSASSKYSSVKRLRENKIKVKAENRAGKMHMKSIIIDDKYVIIGSMNFTKSGEKYNDENVLIIENPNLAKAFKNNFLYFWKEIPDKWMYKNPGAESFNSINSCFDGIDNDFDGKIDKQDEGCMYKKKTVIK